jgi:DNA-binding transcriptional ArsR family regulator
MARADRKLFRLLADEVCYDILRALLDEPEPLAQRDLVRLLGVASSTISRRINDLEDAGLVARTSKHGVWRPVYEGTTRELLRSAAELMAMTHAKLSDDAVKDARTLKEPNSPEPSLAIHGEETETP